MANTLRQQIVGWAEQTGGFALTMTGGVVGSFFIYGPGEEVMEVVHFIVGLGHTSTFTEDRLTRMRGFGYLTGIVRNFEEFKELVCGIASTESEERRQRERDYIGPESSRGKSPST